MRKLIDQIVARELDTAIIMLIIASPDMIIDFDAAVAHIKGYIENREDTVVTGKRDRDGRHITVVDTRIRAPNEWKQIPKGERDEILQERRRKKQKRESGSNKEKDASNGSKQVPRP